MTNLYKNILWSIAIFFAASFIFSFFLTPIDPIKPLTIDQLAAKIAAGQVKQIVVNGQDLAITLADDTKAKSRKLPIFIFIFISFFDSTPPN